MKTKKRLTVTFLAAVCAGAGALSFAACAHKHSYSEEWSHDATNHWHECASCDERGDEAAHSWNNGVSTKLATSVEYGEKTYSCTVCGETKVEQTPKAEHKWNNGTVEKAASCFEAGVMKYTCTVSGCNETKTEPIEKIAHSWDEGTVTREATCQTEGVKTYTCTVTGCGETKTETIAVSTAHNWDEGTVTKQPTCQETGEKLYTCTVDGCTDTKTETLGKGDHNYSTAWSHNDTHHWHACQTAGCTENGSNAAHIWGEWEITVQPTEETPGTKKRICTQEGCGAFEEDTVPELNHEHSYTPNAYESDKDGHWQVCLGANCHQPTDKVAHNWGEGVITKPATALEAGNEKFTCTVCGYERNESIAKIPAYIVRVFNIDGTPAVGATVAIDDKVVLSDENGYAIMTGIDFADYPMFVQKSGFNTTVTATTTGDNTDFEFVLVPGSNALTITESGVYQTYLKGTPDGNGGYTFNTAKITLSSQNATSVFRIKMPAGTVNQDTGNGDSFEMTVKSGTDYFNIQSDTGLVANEYGYAVLSLEVEVLTGENVNFANTPEITATAKPEEEKLFVVTKPSYAEKIKFELPEGVTAVAKWDVTVWTPSYKVETFTKEITNGDTVNISATIFNLFVKSADGSISVKMSGIYDELVLNTAMPLEFDLSNKTKLTELTITESGKYVIKADTAIARAGITVYSASDLATALATGNKTAVANLSAGQYIINLTVNNAGTVNFTARPYMDYDAGTTPDSAQIVYSGDTKTVPQNTSTTLTVYNYFTFTAQNAGTLTLTNQALKSISVYPDASCTLNAELVKGSTEALTVKLGADQKVWIRCANPKNSAAYKVEFEFTPFTDADLVQRTITVNADGEPLNGAHVKIVSYSGKVIFDGDTADGAITFYCYPYDGYYPVEVTLPEAVAGQYTVNPNPVQFSTTNLLGISKNMLFKVTVKGDDEKALEGVTVNVASKSVATDAEGKISVYGTGSYGMLFTMTLENIPEGYTAAASYQIKTEHYSEDDGCYFYECVLETPKAHTVTVKYGEDPAEGVKVKFLSGGEEAASAVTNAEGVSTLTVFKGSYTLEIEDYDAEYHYSGRLPSISAGSQEYEIILTEAFCDYSVTVSKYDGTKVEGALLYLKEGNIIVGAGKTDSDGAVSFGHFKVGVSYKVEVRAIDGLNGETVTLSGTEQSVTLYPAGAVKGGTASTAASTYTEVNEGETFIVTSTGAGFKVSEPNSGNGAKYTITLGKGVSIDSLVYHKSRARESDATQAIKDGAPNDAYTGANKESVKLTAGADGTTTLEIEVAKEYKLFMKLNSSAGYGNITVAREELPAQA